MINKVRVKLSELWYISKMKTYIIMMAWFTLVPSETHSSSFSSSRSRSTGFSETRSVEKSWLHNGASGDFFVISIMENFPSGTNLVCRTLPGASAALASLYWCVKHLSDTPAEFNSPTTAAVNLETACVRFTCYYSPRGEKLPKTRGRSEFLAW